MARRRAALKHLTRGNTLPHDKIILVGLSFVGATLLFQQKEKLQNRSNEDSMHEFSTRAGNLMHDNSKKFQKSEKGCMKVYIIELE